MSDKATQVFEKLGECILRDLNDPERCTAGVYQAALRFVKDAGLEQLPVPGSKTAEIRDRLPFKLKTA